MKDCHELNGSFFAGIATFSKLSVYEMEMVDEMVHVLETTKRLLEAKRWW